MADPLIEVPGEVREVPPAEASATPPKKPKGPQPLFTRGADRIMRMSAEQAEECLAKHGRFPEGAKRVLTERGWRLDPRRYNGAGIQAGDDPNVIY